MLEYELVCSGCEALVEIRATVADYSQGLNATCPHYGSTKPMRHASRVMASHLVGCRLEPLGGAEMPAERNAT